MPTIKDIARRAGVSHGTVSNVLTGKGNVSVEKIRLVEEAARELGYVVNESAKQLRAGLAKSVAVILPDIEQKAYRDLFLGARSAMEAAGYEAGLYLTQDAPENERRALESARRARVCGVLLVSCRMEPPRPDFGGAEALWVERLPGGESGVTFDFARCGAEVAQRLAQDGVPEAAVLTGEGELPHEQAFEAALQRRAKELGIRLSLHRAPYAQALPAAAALFGGAPAGALVAFGEERARALLAAHRACCGGALPPIYAVAAGEVLQDGLFARCELDYRELGRRAACRLTGRFSGEAPRREVLAPGGFPRRFAAVTGVGDAARVHLLTLDAPSSRALQSLAPLCRKQTGIQLDMTILGQSDLYDSIKTSAQSGYYDLIRMDVAWLDELAAQAFLPLDGLGHDLSGILGNFLDGLPEAYTAFGGVRYCLPFDPSMMLLYYRRDLFEDQMLRRMYYERYHEELAVPASYAHFNRVAAFFTRASNASSPTPHGLTMVLGLPLSVACEFLPRLLEAGVIPGDGGRPRLDDPRVLRALRAHMEAFSFSCGRPDLWWRGAVDEFAAGRAAMCTVFMNHASDLTRGRMHSFPGRIGFAPMPGGHPLLGGGVIGVSRGCRDPQAALALAGWLYSREISCAITYLGGLSPCRWAFENSEVLESFPWLRVAKGCFAACVRRFDGALGPRMTQKRFENLLGQAVRGAVLGITPPEEALRAAQEVYASLSGPAPLA